MSKNLPRKIAFYCLGVFILALGVSLSIRSGLGVAPNSSVAYTLSLITGLDNGLCQALVFSAFVLVQWVALGRAFKPIQWLQVPTSVLFGLFVSLTTALIGFVPTPAALVGQAALSLLGSVFVGVGIFLYLATGIIPMSAEGMLQVVVQKTGKSVSACKLALDCGMVALSVVASLIFLDSPWRSIGLGTVLAALLVSRVMALLNRLLGARYQAFLHGPAAENGQA